MKDYYVRNIVGCELQLTDKVLATVKVAMTSIAAIGNKLVFSPYNVVFK